MIIKYYKSKKKNSSMRNIKIYQCGCRNWNACRQSCSQKKDQVKLKFITNQFILLEKLITKDEFEIEFEKLRDNEQ